MIYLNILLYFIFLLIITELLRRYKYLVFTIFIPGTIAVLIFRPEHNLDIFHTAKIISVFVGIICLTLYRYTTLSKKKWAHLLIFALLLVNISEAAILDMVAGNILNGMAGILLMLTLPIGKISVDPGKIKDLLWDLPYGWIVGYTIWNWSFVAINWNIKAMHHAGILAVPLIISLFRREIWAQSRAFSLGIFLLIVLYDDVVHTSMYTGVWQDSTSNLIISIISAVWMVGYGVYFFTRRPLKEAYGIDTPSA